MAELKGQYRLVLLSNTNQIHQDCLRAESRALFANFERLFFSQEMGLRKPGEEIYRQLLKEMEMKAEESLFVDDSRANIEGAQKVGLRTYFFDATQPEAAMADLRQKLAAGDAFV